MASETDIKRWLKCAGDYDTHVIVVCDTFGYEDYPVYVHKGEDARERASEYNGRNMQKVVEIYNLRMCHDKQLGELRAFNY